MSFFNKIGDVSILNSFVLNKSFRVKRRQYSYNAGCYLSHRRCTKIALRCDERRVDDDDSISPSKRTPSVTRVIH